MDALDGSAGVTVAPEVPGEGEPLPDLLSLGLEELGTIEHPVLLELLAELRDRAGESGEPLWGFASAL
ncbi:FxSxx-COOH cyclophane-containing RiPP peptide [Streptomyces rishiriensis]|uniref:FXSXX-COOH protein n=1 Tax=Streptomyces rishiriensis TaxID=68264 RepID=A0ABU0NW86_STRRH|nr:FxSxx-COOH cyclophane-containing RiPP peptide [Streptomyces rishiriensis]MDQ0583413.1 FXSXX-COOH protein [Streptomyces rishiriensis]